MRIVKPLNDLERPKPRFQGHDNIWRWIYQ